MVDKYIEDQTSKVKVDTPIEGKVGEIDFNTLKSGGIIKQRQKDMFTVRLRCPGGRIPLKKLEKIVEVAEKYSSDYVHISFRQSIELTYVDYRNFKAIKEELAQVDQRIASCGARVRVPTACSGCEYNPNGLMDTQKMAKLVDEKYFGYVQRRAWRALLKAMQIQENQYTILNYACIAETVSARAPLIAGSKKLKGGL